MLGDDNLFASNVDFSEESIIQAYKEVGLVVTVVKHTSVYTSKFLQSMPVKILIEGQETYAMVRNPGRAILQM